jgi:hypothetical protein
MNTKIESVINSCVDCGTISMPIINDNECAICLDQITNTNCVTTECNHKFHASCLFRNLNNSADCPLCRKELVEVPEEENDDDNDDDTESSYDSDTDDESEDEEETVPNKKISMTQIIGALQNHNMDSQAIIKGLLQVIYTNDYLEKRVNFTLMDDSDETFMESLQHILDGKTPVDERDKRTYADVIRGKQQETEKGIGPDIVSISIVDV